MDLFKFRAAIAGLDEATLRQFNSVLVAQINASTRTKQAAALNAFRIGQVVKFNDRAGVQHTMRIDRINQKTVSGVDTKTGMNWRVSPSFLTLVGTHAAPAPTKTPLFGDSSVPGGTVPKPSSAAPQYNANAGSF